LTVKRCDCADQQGIRGLSDPQRQPARNRLGRQKQEQTGNPDLPEQLQILHHFEHSAS
jgi:hypothetical protein